MTDSWDHSEDERLKTIVSAVLDDLFDVVLVLGHDGRPLWRRESTRHPVGLDNESVLGSQLLARLHPDDLPRVLEALETTADDPNWHRWVSGRIHEIGDPTQWRSFSALATPVSLDGFPPAILLCATLDVMRVIDPEHRGSDGYSLAAAAPIGLAVISSKDQLIWANDEMASLTGINVVAAGSSLETVGLPPIVTAELGRLAGMAREGHEVRADVDIDDRHVRLRARVAPDERDDTIVVSAEDVTGERTAELHRAAAQKTFQAAFDNSQAGIALVALDGTFTSVNPAFSEITGYPRSELIGTDFADITHPDDIDIDRAELQKLLDGEDRSYRLEKRYRHASGGDLWVDLRVVLVAGPAGPEHMVATIVDVTERKRVEADMRAERDDLSYQATHDHLTGLPNLRLFEEHLAMAVRRSRRATSTTCLMIGDLDGFKQVNDEHGHLVGDRLLRQVADRLRHTCRESDVVARVGGDEFAVVAEAFEFPEDIAKLAQRIVAAVSQPFEVDEHSLGIGISVGVAAARPHESAHDMRVRADGLCYDMKSQGGGWRIDAVDIEKAP